MSDSSHDPSQPRWWQRGVVYQIYPRSFQDSSADGIGDLNGILSRLPYVAGLGVNAIWLSPFYPSPMKDFGYDVADYCNVDPIFGALDDFDRLVAEAHRLGLRVIIDYVPNHTSDQHPWFIESRSSRDNPKRDWYLWHDPRPDGSMPNNWGSSFGGPAWEWDEATGQYYFHHFLKEQPDLNWRNPEVRAAMLDVLRFWLERGVDGFRMDVVGMLLKDPEFKDNPHNPNAPANRPAADIVSGQINVYNQDLDEVHDIIAGFRQLIDSYGDRCLIGEVWYELPRWIRYYGLHGEGLNLPFNFRLIGLGWTAFNIRQSVDELEAALPEFAWPNYVLGNHDGPRLASRVGERQARVAAMLLLTLRGTPTLYYGDEIGMLNGHITQDMIQDPQGITLGLERTRDVCRTPMQWDASEYAGFSTVQPWLPVSPDYRERNVSFLQDVPVSLLNLYRQLLDLRRRTPALHSGSYRALENGNPFCYTYLREAGGRRFVIALNFTSLAQNLSLPGLGSGRVILSTYLDRMDHIDLAAVELRQDEGLLVELDPID